MIKYLLLFTVLFFSLTTLKAINTVDYIEIGVNGLTCSSCSRTVEIAIRKLDFVENVEMDLAHTMGKIYLKKGASVNMNAIAKAVIDAGFYLGYMKINIDFSMIKLSSNCFEYANIKYQLIDTDYKQLSTKRTLLFIGKRFMSAKQWMQYKGKLKKECNGDAPNFYYVKTI